MSAFTPSDLAWLRGHLAEKNPRARHMADDELEASLVKWKGSADALRLHLSRARIARPDVVPMAYQPAATAVALDATADAPASTSEPLQGDEGGSREGNALPASPSEARSEAQHPGGVVPPNVAGFSLPPQGGDDHQPSGTTTAEGGVTSPGSGTTPKGGKGSRKGGSASKRNGTTPEARERRRLKEATRATVAGRFRLPRPLWKELEKLGTATARAERVCDIYGLRLAGFDHDAVADGMAQLRRAGNLLNQSLASIHSGAPAPELAARIEAVLSLIEAMRGGVQ